MSYTPYKDFYTVTVKDLNQMSLAELQLVSVLPVEQETHEHLSKEWMLAKDHNLNSIYRGFFIDSLKRIKSKNTIPRLIKMYDNETDETVKEKIISATMLYYQANIDLSSSADDKKLLIKFYTKLLRQKLTAEASHDVVRGYVDLNSAENIKTNIKLIDQKILDIEPHLLLGLKFQLAYKSQELEKIYIPSIIKMLKTTHSSDLDEMFFGITKLSYKNLKDPLSLIIIKDYMTSVRNKYSTPTINSSNDIYFIAAAHSFRELCRLGLGAKIG